jgi:hypothetical protein
MRRKEAAFMVAQAAIFVGVLALVAIPSQSANGPEASTTSATSSAAGGGPLVFTSGVSPEGLQLRMVLNSSSTQLHGAVGAKIEVLDTLDQNVTVTNLLTNQARNVSRLVDHSVLCPPFPYVGFAVFEGHITAANVSVASPFQLVPQVETSGCGAGVPPKAVTFLPGESEAVEAFNQTGGFDFVTVSTELNASTILCSRGGVQGCSVAYPGLVGYWNNSIPESGNLSSTSPAFVYFPPGEYTIVAADDWGQYLYATFVVEPSPSG